MYTSPRTSSIDQKPATVLQPLHHDRLPLRFELKAPPLKLHSCLLSLVDESTHLALSSRNRRFQAVVHPPQVGLGVVNAGLELELRPGCVVGIEKDVGDEVAKVSDV